jgi:hypothetical protein
VCDDSICLNFDPMDCIVDVWTHPPPSLRVLSAIAQRRRLKRRLSAEARPAPRSLGVVESAQAGHIKELSRCDFGWQAS